LKYRWNEINDSSQIIELIDGNTLSPQTSIGKIREIQGEKRSGLQTYVLLVIGGMILMAYGIGVLVLNVMSFVNGLGGSDGD
jgi:hypothetical protein